MTTSRLVRLLLLLLLLLLSSNVSSVNAQGCSFWALPYTNSTGGAYIVQSGYSRAGGTATCTLSNCGNSSASLYLKFDPHLTPDWQGSVEGECPITASATTGVQTEQLAIHVRGLPEREYRVDCSCDKPYDRPEVFFCFSASTVVQVLHKGPVLMKDLHIGDKVLTATNQYQPVYAFGHLETDKMGTFFQIYSINSTTAPLEMTGEHLIFVIQKGQRRAIRVDQLQVGDQVAFLPSGSVTTVTKITTKQLWGMYMPLTPDGTIVVNHGIIASAYVSLQKQAPTVVDSLNYFFMTEQTLVHWWLAPYRVFMMLYMNGYWGLFESLGLARSTQKNNSQQDHCILPWLIVGRQLAQDAEKDSFLVRVVVKGVPLILFFGCINLLEYLLLGPSSSGPSMGFFILLSMVVYFWHHRRHSSLCRGRRKVDSKA